MSATHDDCLAPERLNQQNHMTEQNAPTKTTTALLTRFDALPTGKKAFFGKLLLAHLAHIEMVRKSMPGLPPDPIVSIMERLMESVEPKQ